MRKKICTIAVMALLAGVIILCRMAGEALWNAGAAGESAETAAGAGNAEGDKEAEERDGAPARLVVLDPGHGGIDGGKVGVNGAEEKEVNLKISLLTKELLEKEGISVEMTREADERLANTQVGDLKERVRIMNERKPALVVSIHQNSYHEEGVSGAQVFYYTDSSEGKKAAEIIQECLRELDPENTKEAKANNTYYILKKTEVPVVIAECGFLSNYSDAEKLVDEEYQGELAAAVTKGVLQYIEGY